MCKSGSCWSELRLKRRTRPRGVAANASVPGESMTFLAEREWAMADFGRMILALAIIGAIVATAHLFLSYFRP